MSEGVGTTAVVIFKPRPAPRRAGFALFIPQG